MTLNKFWMALSLMWSGFAYAAQGEDLGQLKHALSQPSEPVATEAALALAKSSDPGALEALLDCLATGAPPKVQVAILEGLEARPKRDAELWQVLKHFLNNRNSNIRKHAVTIVGKMSDAKVVPALIHALSDSAEEVRAQAALELSLKKERSAEAPFLKLLEHQDAAAPAAVASIATPGLVHRLSEMLGRVPDPLLVSTFGELLKRTDFGPDPLRLEVVRTLAKMPSVDSTTALIEYLSASTRESSRPSRIEAQKIVDQRSSQ